VQSLEYLLANHIARSVLHILVLLSRPQRPVPPGPLVV